MTKRYQTWLCRENWQREGRRHQDYSIQFTAIKPTSDDGVWSGYVGDESVEYVICKKVFHRRYPHLKLKPGEGPIEVEVTIKPVKKGRKK